MLGRFPKIYIFSKWHFVSWWWWWLVIRGDFPFCGWRKWTGLFGSLGIRVKRLCRLGCELCITTTLHNCVHTVISSLTVVVLLLLRMLVHLSLIHFTWTSTLVGSLWCCFELIEVRRLLAYLRHLYFISTSVIRAHWESLLVWWLNICRARVDWLMMIWLSPLR